MAPNWRCLQSHCKRLEPPRYPGPTHLGQSDPVPIDHAQREHCHSQLLRKSHCHDLVWRDYQLSAGWGLPADGLLGLARQAELQLLVIASEFTITTNPLRPKII